MCHLKTDELIGLHNFGKFVYIAYKIRFLFQIEQSVNATIGIFGREYKNHTAALQQNAHFLNVTAENIHRTTGLQTIKFVHSVRVNMFFSID